MNKQRLRDMSLGFLLCLALVGSYYCGASGNPTNANASSNPTNVNASAMGSTEVVVGGFRSEDSFYIVVIDMKTGDIKFSERYRGANVGDAHRESPWYKD